MLSAVTLLTALHVAAQPATRPTPPSPRDTTPAIVRRGADAARRAPVTPDLDRSAFASVAARELLARARIARLAQDSALGSYEAKTNQRVSVGLGVRRIGRERLLFRSDQAARVRWSRSGGAFVEPTGSRTVIPAAKEAKVESDLDGATTAIPYFPGRETLWFPGSDFKRAQAEVDERQFVHPLAAGSEAYYKYATGDSVSIRLPNGRNIPLRELRVTARRPDWRLFVGSFWFDATTGQLVRAAYRMSVDIDVWGLAKEETRRTLDSLAQAAALDTSADGRRRIARARAEAEGDEPPAFVRGLVSPLRATMSGITVEYGLYQGRFWLPRLNVAEGEGQAGFFRAPVKVEERYTYENVSETPVALPATPARVAVAPRTALDTAVAAALAAAPVDTLLGGSGNINIGGDDRRDERPDSVAARDLRTLRRLAANADSATRRADSLAASGDSTGARRARREADYARLRARRIATRVASCGTDSSYIARQSTRFDGALPLVVRVPCDRSKLATSPDLPPSPYDTGEQLFGTGERDELLKALDLSLQPGWAPQPPVIRYGLAFTRYNRIEGLSIGGEVTEALGRGYTAQADARLGVADLVPNGGLSLARTNGRETLRLSAYHRLAVANDDWGAPLSVGASAAALVTGRDEGFYYRAWGAEFGGSRSAPGRLWPFGGAPLDWRVFAERQRTAGFEPNTQFSLRNVVGDGRFVDNIAAASATEVGVRAQVARSVGENPTGLRLSTVVRVEGAAGTFDYTRGTIETTVSHGVGPASLSITGGIGGSGGTLPAQRGFYLGGLQTVRGQFASPIGPGQVGNTFWLGRAELGTQTVGLRPVVFYDVGWAGARDRFTSPGRPISGAGVGLSFLDGLVRTDLSRGIAPQRKFRFDISLDARF